jgi:hypothetical protein
MANTPLECQGLLIEGRRRNFVPSAASVSEAFRRAGATFSVTDGTVLGVGDCWQFRLTAGGDLEIAVPVDERIFGYAFSASAYVWSEPRAAVTVVATLRTNDEVRQSSFSPREPRDRVCVSVVLSNPHRSAQTLWRFINRSPVDITVFFAWPVVEVGPFASNPIPPGDVREPDLIDLKDPSAVFRQSTQGTLLLTLRTHFSAHELTENDEHCFVGAANDDRSEFFEIQPSARLRLHGVKARQSFMLTGTFTG